MPGVWSSVLLLATRIPLMIRAALGEREAEVENQDRVNRMTTRCMDVFFKVLCYDGEQRNAAGA